MSGAASKPSGTNATAVPVSLPRPADTVTLLSAAPGKLASKQFVKASPTSEVIKRDYDAGYNFAVLNPWPVSSIYELSALLEAVEELPETLIIRGAPVTANIVGNWVQRRGSGEDGAFVGNFRTPAAGRHYAMIDIDKYALPRGWKLSQKRVADICEHLVQQLPQEFHDVSYHWQLSSSAGIGDPTVVSMHLWFWFDRAVSDAELKAWARHINAAAGNKLVDEALFQHVQPHYTAAPVFTGMDDPFPCRSGLVQKTIDSVALLLPVPDSSVKQAIKTKNIGVVGSQAGSGFEHHLAQIGDHHGGNGFHMPIIQSIASYVAEHGAEGTNTELLYTTVRHRVLAANRSKHADDYVEEMAGGKHILAAIAGAQIKYGNEAGRRRKTRRIDGIEPHFKDGNQDAANIQQNMRDFLAIARK